MGVLTCLTLLTFQLCTLLKSATTSWPETRFSKTQGHYPADHCHFTDVVLDADARAFLYRSEKDLHTDCFFANKIWPIRNASGTKPGCDETFDIGHVFTIYYFAGGSNYFHLHYDLLLPLYLAVHHKKEQTDDPRSHVLMPTVESRRLEVLDWNTKAFENDNKYWVQLSRVIASPYTYMPLQESLLSAKRNICFKDIYFGTQSVQFSSDEVINGFVHHIQKVVDVKVKPFEVDRIGLIARSNRRRILNEDDLIAALSKIAITEKVEFYGMSFQDQVALMQRYTVLVGINGAGLTNGLYLPPYGVVVQLVPYKAQLNFNEFGVMLKCRGPYLEWHNTHENMTRVAPHDKYNNNADTVVHTEELKKVMLEALELSKTARETEKFAHQEL